MENFSIHLEPVRAFLFQIGAFIPRLLLAVVVVIAGWLVAKVVRFAVIRALRAINFHVLTERAGIDKFLRQGGMAADATAVFGMLAYWLVILAALLIAFNGLGLTYITDLLGRVVWFVPNVFVALLILAFGAYFARFVGDAVTTYGRNVRSAGRRVARQAGAIRDAGLRGADRAGSAQGRRRHRARKLPGDPRRRGVRAGAGLRPGRQGLGGGTDRALVAARTTAAARSGPADPQTRPPAG